MGVRGSRGLLCSQPWDHGVLPQSRHIGWGFCRLASVSDTAPPFGDLEVEAVFLAVSESGEGSLLADETSPGLGRGGGREAGQEASLSPGPGIVALGLPVPWRREGGWPPPPRSLSGCGCPAWCTERVRQPVLHARTGRFLFLSFAIEMTLPIGGAEVPLAWVLELLILQIHPAVPVRFVHLS